MGKGAHGLDLRLAQGFHGSRALEARVERAQELEGRLVVKFHGVVTTAGVPAESKARWRPTSSSPRESLPRPVSQAESTTRHACISRPKTSRTSRRPSSSSE